MAVLQIDRLWQNAANSEAFFTEIRLFAHPSESKSVPSSFIQPYVPLSSISSTALCKRRKAFYFALPALLFSKILPFHTGRCCIMDYVKVRNFLILDFQNNFNSNNLRKPTVVTDLAIPLPFAYAIQQLGIVSAVDLQYQINTLPLFPIKDTTLAFLLDADGVLTRTAMLLLTRGV